MGNSLMVMGSKLGMDVRLCAPEHLWPDEALVKTCQEIAQDTGAEQITRWKPGADGEAVPQVP